MGMFLLLLLPTLSFLSGIVGLQSDPKSEKKKKIIVVLVLALSAIGSVVASLYQQQSDDEAKRLLQNHLNSIEGSNTRVEGTTGEIKTMLLSLITANGFSPEFVQAREQNGFAAADLKLVQQSVTAGGAVQGLAPGVQTANQRQHTTVTYYAKDVEPSNVNGPALLAALRGYGFSVEKATTGERNPGLATNAVWAGDSVPSEQWKLVALTLMRAGLRIRAIQGFKDQADGSARKPNTIEIGADKDVQHYPPLTVQAVQDMNGLPRR